MRFVLEEEIQFAEDGVGRRLWGVVHVIVVLFFLSKEIFQSTHDILVEDVINAHLHTFESWLHGIVGRRDDGIGAELAVGDERAP